MATCNSCHGSGAVDCPVCKGKGRIYQIASSYTCQNCKGSGKVKCNVCDGKGRTY
jgi:DnaJ-class molecular chaperone